ncbi:MULTISPECIES: hypothetical protein [Pseudomonas]|uniref:hypothetical protein n=1 Tax=Pseudomonas TaxID=286 RepID=UPI0005FB9C7E|nr:MULTISPECIES: hypothetical protein [Pseudomonas]KJZ50997.1 hypothetical protein VC37_25205 [Pseudomonas marginalis]KJZ60128.1 hypothetical protein VC36_09270 [Pseudomonas marginalis]MCF5668821.1 hypothetical protein [Pseudomonas marginalis]MCM2377270.1 hypothetical protein [Pseudomonas marginalis]PLR63603.1 hypothetical protein QCBJ_10785 [Pseudomonas sp. QC2]
MNSEKIPPAHSVDFNIVRQAIVDRSHALWGSEIRIAWPHTRALPETAYKEALHRIDVRRSVSPPSRSHKFLHIDQAALMNADLHKQIVQTAQSLEKHSPPLTLCIDNPLDALPSPVERRAMVRQLYKLKDQCGITLAYNNYRLDTKQADLLIDLELYNYIKMPFPDSALRLSLNTRSDLFDRLYDRMLALINTARVCFIADTVEFADSALLAKHLPFEYFQGGYYSPADCL